MKLLVTCCENFAEGEFSPLFLTVKFSLRNSPLPKFPPLLYTSVAQCISRHFASEGRRWHCMWEKAIIHLQRARSGIIWSLHHQHAGCVDLPPIEPISAHCNKAGVALGLAHNIELQRGLGDGLTTPLHLKDVPSHTDGNEMHRHGTIAIVPHLQAFGCQLTLARNAEGAISSAILHLQLDFGRDLVLRGPLRICGLPSENDMTSH